MKQKGKGKILKPMCFMFKNFLFDIPLEAISIVKIGEVWLSDEIGGVETLKKQNFIIILGTKYRHFCP